MGSNTKLILVRCSAPPTVEIDTEASAAYVRFKQAKVVRTEPVRADGVTITIDFDEHGHVIGVELVGVKEFGICQLLMRAPITVENPSRLNEVRYVRAGQSLDMVPA